MRYIMIIPSLCILAYLVFLLHTLTWRSGPSVGYTGWTDSLLNDITLLS